ncbi:MAG TPA: DUF4912 domain-containing protein [bacterium]|nr:DUF4912 domain-containing protein [bacterium]
MPKPSQPPFFKKFPKHGQTQVVAFIRDPHCLFVYWEVAEESLEAMKKQLGDPYHSSDRVLRLFRSEAGGENLLREISVKPWEMNRYLEIQDPSWDYFVEVGQLTASGHYFLFAKSNKVFATVSPFRPMAVTADPLGDPPAGLLNYFGQFELPGMAPVGISSAENHRRMRNRYAASHLK